MNSHLNQMNVELNDSTFIQSLFLITVFIFLSKEKANEKQKQNSLAQNQNNSYHLFLNTTDKSWTPKLCTVSKIKSPISNMFASFLHQ